MKIVTGWKVFYLDNVWMPGPSFRSKTDAAAAADALTADAVVVRTSYEEPARHMIPYQFHRATFADTYRFPPRSITFTHQHGLRVS